MGLIRKPLVVMAFLATCFPGCRSANTAVAPILIGANRQAPFSTDTVRVQLLKRLYNGQLWNEYVYQKGYLSEVRNYFLGLGPRYATTYYRREAGRLAQVDYWSWAATSITNYEPGIMDVERLRTTLVFQQPTVDSLQQVDATGIDPAMAYSLRYTFDVNGFLSRIQDSRSAKGTEIQWVRNKQNNVITARYVSLSDTSRHFITTYEYDNQPNPYHLLPLGPTPEIAINSSVNNIVKSTYKSPDGYSEIYSFGYTYRPDGYPDKAVVSRRQTNNGRISDDMPYELKFVYR